jgi:Zn-dependent peptidase ImmA (M78 family)
MSIKPETAATSTLMHFSGGESVKLPVDPVAIARFLGINVYKADLSANLSGMIAKMGPDRGTDIIINDQHAPVRQRFTVAHELGHYFAIHNDPNRVDRPFIHRRDQLSACGTDDEEVFANRFAAQLLMPDDEVRRAAQLGADAARLAPRFHVSLDAMTNRLKNLGIAR